MSLTAKHLSYAYADTTIIDDVNVEVQAGKILVVIGPNGAGKSSLLKLLSGELKPSAGAIHFDQQSLAAWPRRELACVRAVLRQQESLSFAFTVMEMVLMGRAPHGTNHIVNKEISMAALTAMDVVQLKERLYTELSGGEKQRVQLARCFAQIWQNKQSRYLLLDEPVSALDIAHQKILMQQIKKLSNDGVGIVVALHDLNLAAQYADEVLLMNKGCVVVKGSPETVLTAKNIEAVYNTSVSIVSHPELNIPQVLIY